MKLIFFLALLLLTTTVFSASIIQIRRDTNNNWFTADPTLAQGEIGLNITTNQIKFGDGNTTWNNLSYYSTIGSIDWSNINNFPSACPAGEAVTAIGLTLTCAPVSSTIPSGVVWDGNNVSRLVNDVNYQTYSNINDRNFVTGTNAFAWFQPIGNYLTHIWNIFNQDLNTTSNVTFNSIVSTTDMNATTFYGDGSHLTGITVSAIDTNAQTAGYENGVGTRLTNYDFGTKSATNITDVNTTNINTTNFQMGCYRIYTSGGSLITTYTC